MELKKEVCIACINEHDKANPWCDDDELEWKKVGTVVCPYVLARHKQIQPIIEIPGFCPCRVAHGASTECGDEGSTND